MLIEVLMVSLCYLPCLVCQLTWERLPVRLGASLPPARRDTGLGFDYTLNILVLFGGRSSNRILNDTWIYNISSGSWREVQGRTVPAGRFGFVSGISQGSFYIATGQGRNGIFYKDVWCFTVRTELWEQLPGQPKPFYLSLSEWNGISAREFSPQPRYGSAGGMFPGSPHLYVTLGFSNQAYYDTATYDVNQNSWSSEFPCYECNPYSTLYPHARLFHTGVMSGQEQLVIFGGCLSGGGTGGPCPSGDSWLFDGKAKTWTQLDNCYPPSLYSSMALLPISGGERRVVLYGGNQENRQVLQTVLLEADDIGLLDPSSQEWSMRKTTVSAGSFPVRRASAAMVTGEDGIYMFGGFEVDSALLLNDLWLLRGNSVTADGTTKLGCPGRFFNMLMVHGILMTIGWGVFLQWGVFVARYMRTKTPLWFYIHIFFQLFGLLCAIAGFVFAVISKMQINHFRFAHGIIGLIVTILGILQPLIGALKPNKNKHLVGDKKSVVRRVWELAHHWGGRGALSLALVNITLGIFLAVADYVIWTLWLTYLALVIVVYIIVERLTRQHRNTSLTESRFNNCKVDEVDQNGVGNPQQTACQPEISHL